MRSKVLKMRGIMKGSSFAIDGLIDLIKHLPIDITMIELGVYAGESTEIFLKSGKVKNIYCVDMWAKNYDLLDKASFSDLDAVELAFNDRIMDKYSNVTKVKKSTNEACPDFLDSSIDLVYIDANHSYEFVRDDIINYMPKIKVNGYISGHDYNLDGVKKAVDETLGSIDFTFQDNSWLKRIV